MCVYLVIRGLERLVKDSDPVAARHLNTVTKICIILFMLAGIYGAIFLGISVINTQH